MSRIDEIMEKQYEIVSAYQEIALKVKDRESANALAVVVDKLATLWLHRPGGTAESQYSLRDSFKFSESGEYRKGQPPLERPGA